MEWAEAQPGARCDMNAADPGLGESTLLHLPPWLLRDRDLQDLRLVGARATGVARDHQLGAGGPVQSALVADVRLVDVRHATLAGDVVRANAHDQLGERRRRLETDVHRVARTGRRVDPAHRGQLAVDVHPHEADDLRELRAELDAQASDAVVALEARLLHRCGRCDGGLGRCGGRRGDGRDWRRIGLRGRARVLVRVVDLAAVVVRVVVLALVLLLLLVLVVARHEAVRAGGHEALLVPPVAAVLGGRGVDADRHEDGGEQCDEAPDLEHAIPSPERF